MPWNVCTSWYDVGFKPTHANEKCIVCGEQIGLDTEYGWCKTKPTRGKRSYPSKTVYFHRKCYEGGSDNG